MSIKQSVEFFDNLSEEWDKKIPEIDGNSVFEEWFSSVEFPENAVVLDFGCGTGRLVKRIWEKIKPGGKIFAADFSLGMLNKTKSKYPQIPAAYLCETPETISIPDSSLDIIFLLSMFPHLTFPENQLKKLSSKLKTGGQLWIVHIDSRETINNLHKNIGRPVERHLIPEENEMRKIIDLANLEIVSFKDMKDRYIVLCKKR